ncbi:putative type I restriction enzymeP M protein [Aureliella helgolandensis]|uniref:site-specific DNA-methyltransferase (adenine-specific) n=1 Tax=Aureliella helgolandensis TaxID=2527968 RepID=A0A518GFI9_9BACT|nr:putative type I restriction enzymeP M protein [Aureliella helgolandensis]
MLPHGALFRTGKEGVIRKKLLSMDILDAVIGMGPNLFYGTGLAACIMVFRKTKPAKRRKQILIVDASSQFKKGRAQNEMLSSHVDQIFQWYRDYQDVEGVARCVSLNEIKENDWNLNIPRYIEPVIEEETITVAEAIENLKVSLNAAYEAEDKLKTLLNDAGLQGGGENLR